MDKIMSTIYIDEAGDLGANKGSRWFVISAVIVDKQEEQQIRKSLAQIRTRLNINEVHMRKIKEFERRAYAVKTLSSDEFTFISVLVDTTKLKRGLSPNVLYNYSCRYLIERVSWYLRDTNRYADIVLSSRGTFKDAVLQSYLGKLISFPSNEVYADSFGRIEAKTPQQWELLQLADVCATSVFLCYEERTFGFRLPCFFAALENHVYKRNGRMMKYGIKFFQDEMVPTKENLKNTKICT